jgi:hypothetical protein
MYYALVCAALTNAYVLHALFWSTLQLTRDSQRSVRFDTSTHGNSHALCRTFINVRALAAALRQIQASVYLIR